MRSLFSICLALILLGSSGCMVLEEIDAASAKMPASSKKPKAESKTAKAPAASSASEKRNALLEESKQWWDKAPSLAPTEVEASVVRCRLRDGTQFMSKDDCLSRGGTPQGVSG